MNRNTILFVFIENVYFFKKEALANLGIEKSLDDPNAAVFFRFNFIS